MTIDANEWVNASHRTRKGQSGGCHVYIDSSTMQIALRNAGIPMNRPLKVRRYALKDRKNTAIILLKFRVKE